MKKELITLWPTFLKKKKKSYKLNAITAQLKKIFSLTFSTLAL